MALLQTNFLVCGSLVDVDGDGEGDGHGFVREIGTIDYVSPRTDSSQNAEALCTEDKGYALCYSGNYHSIESNSLGKKEFVSLYVLDKVEEANKAAVDQGAVFILYHAPSIPKFNIVNNIAIGNYRIGHPA